MLAKLKYPKQYLNYGVCGVFPEGYDYPVKRKIIDIKVSFSVCNPESYTVLHVFVDHEGWLPPNDVYMTKKSALSQVAARLIQAKKALQDQLFYTTKNTELKIDHLTRRIDNIRKHVWW